MDPDFLPGLSQAINLNAVFLKENRTRCPSW
jgi:hypothetical protein